MSTNEINATNETAVFGSGLWIERNGQEWIILRSLFQSDLYRATHSPNRINLELYASIEEGSEDYSNDEIIARLFSKIHPRNTEQGEQQ